MGVAVYNISATSARVTWPKSPSCLDTFYSVMYDPNWNSLLMGYKRKSFMHEERIPVSQTSTHLANLLPQTAYFLCVTCQAANPVRDQCQVFSTLSESSDGHDRAGWELAMGVWLTCCILLLVIAGILLWGCLHTICSLPSQAAEGCSAMTDANHQDMSGSGHLYTPSSSEDSSNHAPIIQTPLIPPQTTGHIITQDHELRTLAKLSGSEPV
ncbi:fibronectin type III domain-containing protein 9 [Sphaeramia orbicularis]|uniref:fibronectin type III domain-containing protein 9 n=1 Tax=Sphaeramia orbicularis TaxID=375764 RepID=UPI00117C4EDF|nr:fibronectin type III domain-containing protein 9 [Sphaeramia orbicularis]